MVRCDKETLSSRHPVEMNSGLFPSSNREHAKELMPGRACAERERAVDPVREALADGDETGEDHLVVILQQWP